MEHGYAVGFQQSCKGLHKLQLATVLIKYNLYKQGILQLDKPAQNAPVVTAGQDDSTTIHLGPTPMETVPSAYATQYIFFNTFL